MTQTEIKNVKTIQKISIKWNIEKKNMLHLFLILSLFLVVLNFDKREKNKKNKKKPLGKKIKFYI